MGELFKHFEGWDVQALRQEIADAKKEAEKAKEETEKIKEEAEKVKEEIKREQEIGIQKFLRGIKKFHATNKEAAMLLMEEYQLSAEEAEEKVSLYW